MSDKGKLTPGAGHADLVDMEPPPGVESQYGTASGTSIFDPVLCELVYRWFCPPGGLVLDPFAGGSVRGIVAAKLGREYIGIELRPEQTLANRAQAARICAEHEAPAARPSDDDALLEQTPIEAHGDYLVKRDDAYCVAGVRGGKARTCWHLAQGATGLVTAGSRQLPQANIVAQIARRLGLPCRIHTPQGALSSELLAAQAAGAEIVQHKAGYNNVIIARAREDAAARGWREIPFGMECEEATRQTRRQVANLPADVARIVIPVGSGMSLAGLLWGLSETGRSTPVLGVVVGARPEKRLDRYAPKGWRQRVTLVSSGLDYHAPAEATRLGDLSLDPIYEAKCLPFLQAGDLLWVVGIRQTTSARAPLSLGGAGALPRWIDGDARDVSTLCSDAQADLIFSCPPYADLEVYSDDPRDLSTLDYDAFRAAYTAIIRDCAALLKPDRFACFVVGDVRDPKGLYRKFPWHTIEAFEAAGLTLYNEAVLVTAVGSLPIRVGRQFDAGRKLGKTHQNVLVFVKGDPRKATAAIGIVDYGEGEMPEASTE